MKGISAAYISSFLAYFQQIIASNISQRDVIHSDNNINENNNFDPNHRVFGSQSDSISLVSFQFLIFHQFV